MKKSILICIVVSFQFVSQAQIKFQHIIGGSGYDDAQEIIQVSGGYVMCGTTEGFGAGQSDILVIRTNDSGVVQWSKAYGSAGNDFGVGIKKAPGGGFIIAGYTYGLSTDTLTNDFLLIKINGTGNVEWAKTYGGPANDEAHAIAVMPDSGFVIAGTTSSYGGAANQSGYVVRTDKDGVKLWSKAITQNSDQQLFAIEATDDGGCVVAGYTYVSTLRLFDILVSRLNPNGSNQWTKSYGGNNTEQAFSVKQSLTGGFIVSGYTSSFGNGQDDAFILRLNESGNSSWFSTYGSASAERGKTVLWGTGDGILIGGYAKISSAVGPIDNNFLLKADTSGNVVWSKTYGPSINVSVAYTTALCDDGGYVMSGLTGGFGAQQNDVYTVKVNTIGGSGCSQGGSPLFSSFFSPSDSSGAIFTNGGVENTVAVTKTNAAVSTIIECNSTGLGMAESKESEKITIFPNPAIETISIFSANVIAGATLIQIQDVSGKVIYENKFDGIRGKISFPVSQFDNGFYQLKLISKTTIYSGKFVIQK